MDSVRARSARLVSLCILCTCAATQDGNDIVTAFEALQMSSVAELRDLAAAAAERSRIAAAAGTTCALVQLHAHALTRGHTYMRHARIHLSHCPAAAVLKVWQSARKGSVNRRNCAITLVNLFAATGVVLLAVWDATESSTDLSAPQTSRTTRTWIQYWRRLRRKSSRQSRCVR